MSYNIDYNSFKTDINLTQYCASKGGDLLTMRLKEVIAQSHFKNEPHRHSPEISGFDWNDELNQQLEEKKQC